MPKLNCGGIDNRDTRIIPFSRPDTAEMKLSGFRPLPDDAGLA